MIRRIAAAAALGLLLAACAGGPPPEPPAPPPLDPVGTYDIGVAAEGMEIAGIMTIQGNATDGYTGSIDTEMGGAAITNIAVDGQTLTFSIPDAGAEVQVLFAGDEFSGSLSGAMGDANIWGRKRTG